ncbi:HrcA family transcriptional regulator [Synechococcus sp. RSCCF101]|uniref:HrcA family transcriptional regulator n=1 Tax=Synechococcus sp. RSCCF101 TaxID=2511069 RepID=UPI001244E922|nr:HrcA family transcriptional regulator [Synechococcus sp. RSCCF101]QEY32864.1 HrcA family transcriptional regulator [Synechococcus sp. RSCCF101]
MHPLPERQRQVLQATVRHYVDTTEPVGSKTLVRRFQLQASPATVRSAMGALEQRGLLMQPHTSAGRIPSQQGYRHYVDCLMPAPGGGARRLEGELAGLTLRWASLDDLLLQLARRLADFTGLLSVITRPRPTSCRLQAVRLVASGERLTVLLVEEATSARPLNVRLPRSASDEVPALERWLSDQLDSNGRQPIDWDALPRHLRTSGAVLRQALDSDRQAAGSDGPGAISQGLSGLLCQPEFQDPLDLRRLVALLEESPHQLVPPPLAPLGGIWIGEEHPLADLQHCSVVQAPYSCLRAEPDGTDAAVGQVALVGPMRMAYATARAAVRAVAGTLTRLLS